MGERKRIGQRHIRALRPGQVVWDSAVIGFGARRQRSEVVSYFVFYRTAEGRQRWQTIGRHGAPWVPDTARDEARRLRGDVARGEDPAGKKQAIRKAVTVGELCDRYMTDAKAGLVLTRFGEAKKASTLAIDEGRIARHIKPVLGPPCRRRRHRHRHPKSARRRGRREDGLSGKNRPPRLSKSPRRKRHRNTRAAPPRRHLHLRHCARNAHRQSGARRSPVSRRSARTAIISIRIPSARKGAAPSA